MFVDSVKYSRHYTKLWYYSSKYDDRACVWTWPAMEYPDKTFYLGVSVRYF